MMTPRVVRTDVDVREVSEELRDRLRGLDDDELLRNISKRDLPRQQPVNPVQPLAAP